MEELFTLEENRILSQEVIETPEELAMIQIVCRRKIDVIIPQIKILYDETEYDEEVINAFCEIEAYYLLYLQLKWESWLRQKINNNRREMAAREGAPKDFRHIEDYKKGTAAAFKEILSLPTSDLLPECPEEKAPAVKSR